MDKGEWKQRGHVDRIIEYHEKQKYNESGQLYVCIKPDPEENKKKKSIN